MPTYSQLTKQERESYQERAKKALEHWGIEPSDYRRLAVIEHQLQRWYEQECNGEIERCEETGKVYRVIGHDQPGATIRRLPYKDMETGAIKRAEAIANKYQGWIFIQGDPRGCVVYFWRSGEPSARTIGPDEEISQHYSTRALAIHF